MFNIYIKISNYFFFHILAVSGSVEHGNHYTISMIYEHKLERSSSSMVYGPFGNVKGKWNNRWLDFIECETIAA